MPLDLLEIPEWDGEPTELFGTPPSDEGEAWEQKLTSGTGYHFWHVLDDAGSWCPELDDQLAALHANE